MHRVNPGDVLDRKSSVRAVFAHLYRQRQFLAGGLALIALILVLTINLDRDPHVWWDEGWTLNVARNWIESGHFGQLLEGQPRSIGLSASFPNVIAVAIFFKLFGIGVWQGRMMGVFFTLAALAVLYLLTSRLYSRKIAWGALFVAVCMAPHMTNPIYMGRQVMAEMPMVFFLLAGYYCLMQAVSVWFWLFPASICWGIAIITKGQPLPFLLISLLLPWFSMLIKRQWRLAAIWGASILGSVCAWRLLMAGWESIVPMIPNEPLIGLTSIVALTLEPVFRMESWIRLVFAGLPTLMGLIYAAWSALRKLRSAETTERSTGGLCPPSAPSSGWIKFALGLFCSVYLLWYITLSVGWARYLFPVLFLGSPFLAGAFYDWTGGYSIPTTVLRGGQALRRLRFDRFSLAALWSMFAVVFMVYLTLMQASLLSEPQKGQAIYAVADYLDRMTPADALIESYDPVIFFLIHRRYHYPPDQANVEMIKMMADPHVRIEYDPLAADPDYIVVGRFSRAARLYEDVLKTGEFRKVFGIEDYEIYARIRN